MIRADKRRYHYIYKTTCIITNRFYIGMHSTEDLNDGYIGSGTRLWHSINKHGKENHICEILEYLDSRKELAEREKEIITEEMLVDSQCLNLNRGGHGGWTACNNSPARLIGPKIGAAKFSEYMKNSEYRKKFSKIISKSLTPEVTNRIKESRRKETGNYNECRIGIPRSVIAIEKSKQTFNQINHQQGENNSQFGTCWIYHELIGSKKCKKVLLPEYIDQGWYKGRRF